MINLFFPYYKCGDLDRQEEIDFCLQKNIENSLIDKLIVLIDDGSLSPFSSDKITVINLDKRPTYKKWIDLTKELRLSGISVLCNSDIYFDDSIEFFDEVLDKSNKFVALSRWELIGGTTSLHPNPHWSQDVWAMNCDNYLSTELLHQLDFPMGVPRCDNKIAYLFGIYGWEVFNPCNQLKSFHVHETEMRTYHKKLDIRIIGGVAYVHPGKHVDSPAELEFDVWVRVSKNIKDVKLNKSLEKWFIEEEENQVAKEKFESGVVTLLPCTSSTLVNAIKNGTSLKKQGPNFELFQLEDEYVFKNAFSLKNIVGLKVSSASTFTQEQIFAIGIIPPILDNFTSEIGVKAKDANDLNFWQYPCATEKQAYENHLSITHGDHIDTLSSTINLYVPLPWATYIDRKAFPETYLQKVCALINQYKAIAEQAGITLKVHSVCQHIHWIRILDTIEGLGITDLHISHKDSKSDERKGKSGQSLRLHGWPLIAVNYVISERSKGMERKPIAERKLLASFIGAHMPHYLDDSRIKLFEAAKACGREDVLVDLGKEWHFNKIVYEEQVLSKEIESHHIDEHDKKTFRYNTILSDSKFSLCPVGAGPNTLRFWESIAVGSIPVIFSDDLAVFEAFEWGGELLENCIIYNNDISQNLFHYLKGYNAELQAMSNNLIKLFDNKISNLELSYCYE